jgi:DNA recombination protein RmuC
MMNIVFLIIGLGAGYFIGMLITKSKNNVPENNDELLSLKTNKAVLEEKLKDQERTNAVFAQELKSQINQLKIEIEAERAKLGEANKSLEQSRTFFKAQDDKLKEQRQQIEDLQLKLTKDFENIANKILTENSSKFTEQNKTNLDGILNPLRERIKDFEEKVDKAYKSESAERNTLKGSIEELMKLNKQISEEANNLTNALKGDTKKQGNWGEFVLEKILESSGLVENENYTLQGKGMSLVDEDGNRFQPDVVINLPDEKHLIIDSKVSLIAYEKLLNANSEEEREKYIKEHVTSIRAHVQGLSAKNYQDLYGIHSPDFVLLFIPIESSFSVASQYDRDLFEFAWTKRIVLVSPSTLLATLKTVSSVWKQEKHTKNALEIAKKAGLLYDKFVGFIDDLKKMGDQLGKAQESYNSAFGKLHEGKGSLTNSVESLRVLGLKTKKKIDKNLLEESSEEEVENEEEI